MFPTASPTEGRPPPLPRRPGATRSRDTGSVLTTAFIVLAHQGGWDEMLMVLTPIAVFALLLKLANSRAKAAQAAREAAGQPATQSAAQPDPDSSRESPQI